MNYSVWQIVSAVLYIMNMGLAVYIAGTMILRKQDPVKTLSWAIVLVALPYIGIIIYLFFGQNYRKKKIYGKKGDADLRVRKSLCAKQNEYLSDNYDDIDTNEWGYVKLLRQNLNVGYYPVEFNKSIDFFFTGRDALDAIYSSIEGAKRYVHLQFYIIENDRTGAKFKDLLVKKARSGVEVRIIYDGLGSYALKRKYAEELRSAGVEVLVFSPVRLLLPTFTLNYRNHRKIVVVDGKEGFIGGVNIADRYYYGTESGDWHDTHIKIVGDAVTSLQSCFLQDRYFILNKNLKRKRYFPPKLEMKEPVEMQDTIISQTIVSGPDSFWSGIMLCYLGVISQATHHIYIVSPYFTPSETILNAIKIAALGGVDVRIMLPEASDSRITHWSTMSYVQELLDAGVRIYLFGEGFNHSEVVSIDGKMAIVGSANMDMRSFEHNFEIMSLIYNEKCAMEVESQFEKDITLCKLVTNTKWKKRPVGEKVKESFGRLWSPLL